MPSWCPLLCLLITSGTTLPGRWAPPSLPPTAPSLQLTVGEALSPLPFQAYAWGHDPQNAGLAFPYIVGVGSVTPQEVAEALKLAGIEINLNRISVLGAPKLPPLLQPDSPVQAELSSAAFGRSGAPYQVAVKLTNTTPHVLEGIYGADAVNAVLEDRTGTAVFWATMGAVSAVGYLMSCPPLKACDRELKLNFDLNRFQPRLPLEPGKYTLKVLVTSLVLSTEGNARSLSFQLPARTLTILP